MSESEKEISNIVYCWHCSKQFKISKDGKKEFFVNCPHCEKGFNDLSLETQKAVINTFRQFKMHTKTSVFWVSGGIVIIWDSTRTPKLGWNELTLLEALTDSAKTLLAMDNINGTKQQLNNILTILRKKIEKEKPKHKLLNTCQYRETKRTRCNKYPTTFNPHFNLYLCEKHYKEQEKSRNFNQKTLEEIES